MTQLNDVWILWSLERYFKRKYFYLSYYMSFKIFVFILPLHVLLYFTFFSEKKLYLCVKLYRKLSCKIELVGYNIFSFQRKKNQKNLFFLQIIDIYMYMWYTSDKIKIFNMKSFYLTPSKQIFWGGRGIIEITLSVCLSVSLWNRVQSKSF